MSAKVFGMLAILSLLLAVYTFAGVLQAALLFTGERAVRNVHVWGSATLVCLTFAGVLVVLAVRARRRGLPQ